MFGRLSRYEKRWIYWIAAFGGLSRLLLALRSNALLATRPYIEDSFYVFSCARNLARGLGFTVDGVHPTNGVQPLICLLYTPCFWFSGDKWTGLRLTFIVSALIVAMGALLLSQLVSSLRRKPIAPAGWWQSSPILAGLAWVCAAPFLVHDTNGLETGLTADMILLSLIVYHRELSRDRSFGRDLLFGVVLGLTVLARIDCVLLVAAFAVHQIYLKPKEAFIRVFTFGSAALIVTMPWWMYNSGTFGALMPLSGQSEAIGSMLGQNAVQTVAALSDILSVFFYHNVYQFSFIVHLLILFVIVQIWTLIFRSFKIWGRLRIRYRLQTLVPLALFSLALIAYYNFNFAAPHFLARYLNPLRLLWLLIFAMSLPIMMEHWKDRKPSLSLRAMCSVLLILVLGFSLERYVNNFTTNRMSELYQAGVWASKTSGKIGMDQSATASFISPNVVNLDGKINQEALRARLAGKEGSYIALSNLDYLIDWPEFVRPLVAKSKDAGVSYSLDTSIGKLEVYRVVKQ